MTAAESARFFALLWRSDEPEASASKENPASRNACHGAPKALISALRRAEAHRRRRAASSAFPAAAAFSILPRCPADSYAARESIPPCAVAAISTAPALQTDSRFCWRCVHSRLETAPFVLQATEGEFHQSQRLRGNFGRVSGQNQKFFRH